MQAGRQDREKSRRGKAWQRQAAERESTTIYQGMKITMVTGASRPGQRVSVKCVKGVCVCVCVCGEREGEGEEERNRKFKSLSQKPMPQNRRREASSPSLTITCPHHPVPYFFFDFLQKQKLITMLSFTPPAACLYSAREATTDTACHTQSLKKIHENIELIFFMKEREPLDDS